VPGVLVDASGLIALLDRDDSAHERTVEAIKNVRDRLSTVWPALTEAMHLLRDTPHGADTLCDMVSDDALVVLDLEVADMARIKVLMQKYRDLPMDFADAALVRVAERARITRIVTLDAHFQLYRLPHRARFVVLPLPARVR
jgi:predicted nucleic acid-binding protein